MMRSRVVIRMADSPSAGAIDRVSAEDLVSLASDVGPAPMQVGAVLLLDGETDLTVDEVRAAVAERILRVPRLRQRLVPTPPGCGRPLWVDDTGFDIDAHVTVVRCPATGDEQALLDLAADLVATRLPAERPLWRLTAVSGLAEGRTALVVAFHHVLADGIGGLAVLANLVDGDHPPAVDDGFPRQRPSVRALARDAARGHLVRLAQVRRPSLRLHHAVAQLRSASAARPSRCSLNRPTGARRRLTFVRTDLEDVHRVARAHAATINDVVLCAVAGALRRTLASRGERLDRYVVSVPVSARREATATDLGNQVGVVPVDLPATGDPFDRLVTVARETRLAKETGGAGSTAWLGPFFRLLAWVGLLRWFIDRQRLVHTFVTNLRGPDHRLSFLGTPISDVVAVAVVTGNVTVSFAVLSYAGALGITVIADADAWPDLPTLRDALVDELDQLTGRSDAPTV